MKIIKELKEQYAYLWWWLLNQGIFISTILVNIFMFTVFALAMGILIFFLKFFGKH